MATKLQIIVNHHDFIQIHINTLKFSLGSIRENLFIPLMHNLTDYCLSNKLFNYFFQNNLISYYLIQ